MLLIYGLAWFCDGFSDDVVASYLVFSRKYAQNMSLHLQEQLRAELAFSHLCGCPNTRIHFLVLSHELILNDCFLFLKQVRIRLDSRTNFCYRLIKL